MIMKKFLTLLKFSCYFTYALVLMTASYATQTITNNSNAASQNNDGAVDLSSDIYGGQEAPLDLNILPWQKTNVKLAKPEITSSILERIMRPIDRESLKRELNFIESTQQQ